MPEERLTRRQAGGFNLVGFAVPFAVLGALTSTLASMSLIIVIPLVVGIYMVVRDGVRASGRWWRNAGVAVANGASNGLMLALFMVMMFSCTSGLGRAGYVGYRYW